MNMTWADSFAYQVVAAVVTVVAAVAVAAYRVSREEEREGESMKSSLCYIICRKRLTKNFVAIISIEDFELLFFCLTKSFQIWLREKKSFLGSSHRVVSKI